MKLVHFDSHRKSTFVLWLRTAHFNRIMFYLFHFLPCGVSRNDLWALMYPTEPILCVNRRALNKRNGMNWNEMNGWMNSINGQVYLWFLKLWLGNANVRWLKWHARYSAAEWVQCVRLLYGNPCAINSFHAFPFWSITPCMHIRTRFAKAALLLTQTLELALAVEETQNLNIVRQWVTVYGITINLRKFIEY